MGSDADSGQLVSELLGGEKPQIWCQKCCEYESKGETVIVF